MFTLLNPKKAYFKRKVYAVTRQIWDFEFKVEKSLQVREGVRQDRDKLLDAKNKAEVALKAKPNDEKLKKEVVDLEDTIKRFESQMKMIDDQINGGGISEDNPAGIGLNEQISSLAELRKMYIDYIKKL